MFLKEWNWGPNLTCGPGRPQIVSTAISPLLRLQVGIVDVLTWPMFASLVKPEVSDMMPESSPVILSLWASTCLRSSEDTYIYIAIPPPTYYRWLLGLELRNDEHPVTLTSEPFLQPPCYDSNNGWGSLQHVEL